MWCLVWCAPGCLWTPRLKYLDQWLDNLSPAFLMPLLAHGPGQVLQPLLGCLYALIKPQPYMNGQDAFRILGKLGGMNREFQQTVGASKLPRYRNHLDSAVVVRLDWAPSSAAALTNGPAGAGQGAGVGAAGGSGAQVPGSFERRVDDFMRWAGAKRVRRSAEHDASGVSGASAGSSAGESAGSGGTWCRLPPSRAPLAVGARVWCPIGVCVCRLGSCGFLGPNQCVRAFVCACGRLCVHRCPVPCPLRPQTAPWTCSLWTRR
jgi:hypothetical protein